MDVRPPHGLDPAEFDRLKAEEKACAQDLQRAGKWVHLWRIAGQYSNISVSDVGDHDQLHALLSTLPLFPFMQIEGVSKTWGSLLGCLELIGLADA